MSSIVRVPPLQYLHILDNITNVTSLRVGPTAYIRMEHETIILGPLPMIRLPPRHYCIIENPIVKDASNNVITDKDGVVKLQIGEVEVRLADVWVEPFPLYPSERLKGCVMAQPVVKHSEALKVTAVRDFDENIKDKKTGKLTVKKRRAGDEWLFEGPGTYHPVKEVEVIDVCTALTIRPNMALKVMTDRLITDRKGIIRLPGEEWLVRETGAYLPGEYEVVVCEVKAQVLTDKVALHLKAKIDFTDVYGVCRYAGSEWLVTSTHTEAHIIDVNEHIVCKPKVTSLNNRQYCVVVNPKAPDGSNKWGETELRVGELQFFLQPGETLQNGIEDVYVMSDDEALLLCAAENFDDVSMGGDKPVKRVAGERWMVFGPADFVPPTQVQVLEKRKSIPLDQNDGIYVRDVLTGKVRSVVGQTYMLLSHEELWQKELPPLVEELLATKYSGASSKKVARDKSRVITLRAPHNSAVQVFDFKNKKSRVIFGPDFVLLEPDESFTLLTLSGNTPKVPGVVKDLALILGPAFSTEELVVETSDHARLSLRLSFNWHFEVDQKSEEEKKKLFQVRDFIGDFTKAIASRIRGCVAAVPFEHFHKDSTSIIRLGVFGNTSSDRVVFVNNCLVVTSVDIQRVLPVDASTRVSLAKSVQLAIEITTRSQEAVARQEAEKLEQAAKARLKRQVIEAKTDAEKSKCSLLKLQAASAAVQSTGQRKAEAQGRAKSAEIEAESELEQSKLRGEAALIEAQAKLAKTIAEQEVEIEHLKAMSELEIVKARKNASIEVSRLERTVAALDVATITAIAKAGPELQLKLLKGLGIRSFIASDGTTPINLFTNRDGVPTQVPAITSA
eukprot:GHVR01174979.1.p1 GENE.GHVR01174979.1~~GHVR01174979.1.p1  ORF type:complete len:844 (+),score=201.61 GHVR01174979.1:148-2679(+)